MFREIAVMVGGDSMEIPNSTFVSTGLSAGIGLLYGIGGIALLPVLLGDFAAYDYAMGAVAGMTVLVLGLGFALGCVAAVPLAMTARSSTVLAGATALAGISGLLCWAFPSSSFPSEILIPLGLYAGSAPVIVAAAAGRAAGRNNGLMPAGGALIAIIVGAVLTSLFVGTIEGRAP